MMRVVFGLVLAVLLSVPSLLDVTLSVAVWTLGHPPVLAFAAGVLWWPRLANAARGWGQ